MMEVNKMVQSLANDFKQSAILAALATRVVDVQKSDDVSEREAWEKYGKAWIQQRTKLGLIHFTRDGNKTKSRKTFSRFEIECVKYAEKGILEIVKMFNEKQI